MAGMKPPNATASPDDYQCRRPGCERQGKVRSQTRNGSTLNLRLCHHCFLRLLAYQLRDLFLQFGVPISIGERQRRKAVRSTVNRPS